MLTANNGTQATAREKIEEYIIKFCDMHNINKETAMQNYIVKEYINWVERECK